MSLEFTDEEMLKYAEELVIFEQDPCSGAESVWKGPVNPLTVWEWAESQGRTELLPGIATAVASEVHIPLYGRGGRNPKYENWLSKLTQLAEDAKVNNDLDAYACFLRALDYFPSYRSHAQITDELISIYQKLGNRKWEIEYLNRKAIGTSLFRRKDAARIYLDIYQKSVEINYAKGICLSLLGFGEYLARGWRNRLAAICLYQARSYGIKGATRWAITAHEELRELLLDPKEYEKEIDLDTLINDVRKALKI